MYHQHHIRPPITNTSYSWLRGSWHQCFFLRYVLKVVLCINLVVYNYVVFTFSCIHAKCQYKHLVSISLLWMYSFSSLFSLLLFVNCEVPYKDTNDLKTMGPKVGMCALKSSLKIIHFVANVHCFHCLRVTYFKTLIMYRSISH